MTRPSNAANNARSVSMNPNNRAFHASVLNRSVQLNPTSALYQGPSGNGPLAGRQPGGDPLAVPAKPATEVGTQS